MDLVLVQTTSLCTISYQGLRPVTEHLPEAKDPRRGGRLAGEQDRLEAYQCRSYVGVYNY